MKDNHSTPTSATSNNWYTPELTANIFVRSSLFSVNSTKTRKHVSSLILSSEKGYEVRYTGEILTQLDRDYAIALKRTILKYGRNNIMRFRPSTIYNMIGKKSRGGNNDELLHASLKRMLIDCTFCFDQKSGSFEGKNAKYLKYNERDNVYETEFNPEFIDFYIRNHDTCSINVEERMLLGNNQLAKWLHAYWSSYEKIPETDMDEINELTGLMTLEKEAFKEDLNQAIKLLADINFIRSKPESYIGNTGLINVLKINNQA